MPFNLNACKPHSICFLIRKQKKGTRKKQNKRHTPQSPQCSDAAAAMICAGLNAAKVFFAANLRAHVSANGIPGYSLTVYATVFSAKTHLSIRIVSTRPQNGVEGRQGLFEWIDFRYC